MGSYDLSPEQLTAILNDEAQKKRMRETAAGYRAAVSLGMDADSATRAAGPVSDLAGRYRRTIEFMPDPDTLAKDAQLAKDSGSPLALIQEDPEVRADAVRRQMFNKGKVPRHERMRQIEESLPATNRFLKRPGNLPFITDDPESLMRGEGMLSTAVRGYLEGALQQELGRLRTSQLLGVGGKDVEDKIADVKSRLEGYGFERPEGLGGRMFYGAGKLLAQRRDQIARGAAYAGLAAGAVGLAAATGGLSVPGTLMTAAGAYSGAAGLAANAARVGFVTGSAYEGFIQEAGLGYDELLEIRGENGEPLDPAVARAGGLVIGAVNAGIEFAQLDLWLKSVPGVRRLISAGVMKKAAALPQVQGYLKAAGKVGMSYLKLLGAESAQEVVQQGTNIVVRNAAKALSDGSFKPDSASDVIAELVETFGSSAIEFSLGMLPGPFAGGVSDMRRIAATREYRINRAKGLASVQAMVNDAAKEGPLARRAPEKMREFLATVNDTINNPFGEVYIDSGVIRTLMADRGYTEEERAVLLEDRLGVTQAEYRAAVESGAALSVRSENFAMLNEQDEELGALLFPELKADPDGIALKDVDAATEEHKANLREELSFAVRAAASSVSTDELKEWARREGLDRVYVDASAVQTLFQDAAPEEKERALEALGVASVDLEQAVNEGGDVEISLDRLFDSGVPNELFDKIKNDLRAEPRAMTARQAGAYAENGAPGTTMQETQEWKEKAERYVRDLEGAHRVKANLKAQLMLAGYGDDAAQASAEVFAARVMRSARRMGLDPETYFRAYANVKFIRGDVGGVNGVLNQDVKINRSDVEAVQRIGAKSVNDFSPDEVKNTSVWARKFQRELGVKSPFFRAWFGDWRANDKTKVEKVRLSGGDPKSMPCGSFVNKDTGWSIDVSRKVGEETRAHSGRDSRRTAISALADIEEIVKNAVLLDTSGAVEAGNKKKIDTVFMHHFYAVVNDGKNDILLKLFVDEMYNTQKDVGQRRAYELKAIKEIPSGVNRMTSADNGSGPTAPDGKYRVADLFNIVKANDGSFNPKDASKVVDANGEPLVVYHGSRTGGGFSVFEGPSFFTDDFDTADMFKSEADYELYINGRNIGLLDGADADDLSYLLLAGDYSPEEISEGGFVIDEDIHDADGLSEFLEEKFSYGFSEGDRIELKRTPGVYGCFLNIRNPLVVDFEGRVWGERVEDRPEAFFERARNEGHDGVIVRNIVEGGLSGELRDGGEPRASTVFVTFDPEQVKSVENTGTFDAGNPNIYLQPAWHGSPFKFDRFSTEHIGEGEGAQAFGWGLYFAGNKEVSEWYRKGLTKNKTTRLITLMLNGEEYRPSTGSTATYDFLTKDTFLPKDYVFKCLKEALELNSRFSLEQGLNYVKSSLRYDVAYASKKDYENIQEIRREKERAEKALRWLEENEKSISAVIKKDEGQLFKVDIPDENTEYGNYLLWDAAVTKEQAERVFKALEERGAPLVYSLIFNGRSLAGVDYGEMIDEFDEAGAAVLASIRTNIHYGDSLDDTINAARSTYERDISSAGEINGRSEEDAAMLSEQAESARDKLAWLEANRDSLSVSSYSPEEFVEMWGKRGKAFYEKLSDMLGSDKEASLLLKRAGFAGIKYLDGSSRRRGEGNYNYVIFDAAAVNILETYYQALNESASEEFKKALPDRVFDSFDGAKEYLRKQLEGTKKGIANESNNILVSLGMNGVKKMLSGKAAEKSLANGFTTKDHITAAANIVKLYRNSELLFEHPDKKERRGVTKIKRFGAPVMLPDAEEASVAYITVREIYGKDNKLYSVELMSFELLKAKEMPSGNLGAGSAEYSEAVSPQTEGISRLSEKLEAVNADYAKFEQKTRGSIAFPAYDGGPVRITLGKGADHSTFVHELAHLYLWHLKRLAALDVTFNSAAFTGPYTASWNNDLKAVFGWWDDNAESIARQAAEFASKEGKDELSADGFRRWLASGMETGSEAGRAYDRAAQEYFARGFEAYLAEGRAPSKELLSVFRRFKQWLCDIYKSLTELDVELSDDIREVFDRMLATEEAVERLKAEREMDAAMAALPGGDAESMGAPPDFGDDPYEAAKEYMLSDLLEKRTPERRKAMTDYAEEIRPEITRAVAEEAGFRAISVMEENPEMRLSADAVLDEFGENVVSAMPEGTLAEKPGEGMTDLTVAAKALGFASAKDMIDAVAGRGSVSSEIDARVRAAVEAEFADEASSPEAMDAAAEAALYETDDTGERIAAEAEVDFAAASEEVRAAEESEAAEETEAEAEPEFADDEEARAYHEAFRDIFEADEAAKAEREYPRSRKNVMAWIRANGGFSYRAVEAAIGREQARELIKKTGPGLFKKDAALGLDTAAQALSSMGVSFESDEALLKVLMKDPAALSPIELAAAEARKETIREFKAEYKALRDKLRSEAQEEKKEGREKLSALRKKLKARYEERTENLRDKYQKMTERQRAEFDERKQRERERKNAARMKRALEKQTEKSVNKKETAGAARLATRNTVTAMTVQRLYDVSGWVKVEKESRAEADKALRARDEERYKGAKRKELYAHEMVRAMYKARGRAEYIRKKLAEYQGRGQKRTFGMTPEYLRQMDAMLSRLDLERRKNKDKLALKPEDMTEQAKPLDEFIREQAEDGTPLLVPKWMLSAAESRKYESLRMDELEEVYKAAQNMMQAGRDENKTIALAKNVELAGIDVQVLARAQGYYGKKKVHGKTVIEVAKEDPKLAADFIADLDTAEAMCRALDGYEDFGPMQDFVFRPIREAVSREYAELNRVFGLFRDLKLKVYGGDFRADMKKRDIGVPEYRRETDEKTGKPYYVQTGRMSLFTQENIICAAFNMGNADNIARLKDGWGWTDKDIERIKDQLTEKDWRYVQGVWDLLEEMWPQIRKVHELLTGTTIEKVEAQKLRTKFGELRGGYYPIVTDLRYSESAASQSERQEVMATAPLDHAQRFAKNGHRKARAENVLGRPPMLSFAVLDNHVANVIHDYELSPAVRDARKILRRDAVRSVIKSVLGERGLRNFNHWLNDVAANTKNNGVARGSGDRFVQGLKSNTAMFALGANLGGALMQPLGYFPLAHRIGFVNAAMAVMSWLAGESAGDL